MPTSMKLQDKLLLFAASYIWEQRIFMFVKEIGKTKDKTLLFFQMAR